jgi:hypothetical protein
MRIDRNSYLDLFTTPAARSPGDVDPTVVPASLPATKGLAKLEAEADAALPERARKDLPAPLAQSPLPVRTQVQEEPEPPAAPVRAEDGPLADILRDVDVHAISPRRMANLSQDLYAAGVIGWDEYSMLAYQPELQPEYDRTIGALTGEPAQPDRPRDFVAIWEDRLAFEERHNPADHRQIQTSRHILATLRQIASPLNLVV